MSEPLILPHVPVKHSELLQYLQEHYDIPMGELLKPYNEYDAVLRKIFAQDRSNGILDDNYLNLVPLFKNDDPTVVGVRARDLELEPKDQKYIMPLKNEQRRPNGSFAIVKTLKDFQRQFEIFTRNSLQGLNWSNVIAAGSSVVISLLPVPDSLEPELKLRNYYDEKLAPMSDVDLFLYGLDEDEAKEKIKHIEATVRNSLPESTEILAVRTQNAITIVSQYPTRHVQIVLRIYKSIAEVLTGFDVDCSCAAYDGSQVYVAPRALAAYITQINHIDLNRRSPSYENRLSKYSHFGFEVSWPDLQQSKVNPVIFTRDLKLVGLARLLVPEKNNRNNWKNAKMWNQQAGEEQSIYETFRIPYGKDITTKKIELFLVKVERFLNTHLNTEDGQQINHRHLAFWGSVEEVMKDCCRCCPVTNASADGYAKLNVSGDISFMKDDPGRQEIGSFHPITEPDWTEMAYLENIELCQAVVNCDIERVRASECSNRDINRWDHTGRTPLHLAVIYSTPEIVQYLLNNGAEPSTPFKNGLTALHFAASRGNAEIMELLITKMQKYSSNCSHKDDNNGESSKSFNNGHPRESLPYHFSPKAIADFQANKHVHQQCWNMLRLVVLLVMRGLEDKASALLSLDNENLGRLESLKNMIQKILEQWEQQELQDNPNPSSDSVNPDSDKHLKWFEAALCGDYKCVIPPVDEDFYLNMTVLNGLQLSPVAEAVLDRYRCLARRILKKSANKNKTQELVRYAISTDDVDLLSFMLDRVKGFSFQYSPGGSFVSYGISQDELAMAIRLGSLKCLLEIMKRYAESLDPKIPIQCGGTEGSFAKERSMAEALQEKFCKTKWYLNYKWNDDKRFEVLGEAGSGIMQCLEEWHNLGKDLDLHNAVRAQETEEAKERVKSLVKNLNVVNTKSPHGYTPLALAFSLRRVEFATILNKHGASQDVQDSNENNILHMLLGNIHSGPCTTTKDLQALLNLIKSDHAESLLTQRSREEPGALTPLARWIHMVKDSGLETDNEVSVLKVILQFSATSTGRQRHLWLLDASGNTPMHTLVKFRLPRLLEVMIPYCPELLLQENVLGRTPLDLAEHAFVSEVISNLLCDLQPNPRDEVDRQSEIHKTRTVYNLCRKTVDEMPKLKRRRIGIDEVNNYVESKCTPEPAVYTF